MDKNTAEKNTYNNNKPTVSYNAAISCKSLFGFFKKDKKEEIKEKMEEIEVVEC